MRPVEALHWLLRPISRAVIGRRAFRAARRARIKARRALGNAPAGYRGVHRPGGERQQDAGLQIFYF